MKLLLIYPGPRQSTYDVAEGYRQAMCDNKYLETRLFSYHNIIYYHKAGVEKYNSELSEDDVALITTMRASRELIADIAIFQPDVLFVVSGTLIPFDTWNIISTLRQNLKEKFAIAWYMTECPYLDNMQYNFSRYADILFLNDKYSLKRFDKNNDKHVYYLPHSYSRKIHNNQIVDDNIPSSDVLFCGTPFYERLEILSQVDWQNIDLKLITHWGDDIDSKFDVIKNYLYLNDTIQNNELADYYRKSKISINIHRTRPTMDGGIVPLDNYTDAYSIGPRLYEIAACESLILTDFRQEAVDIFGDSIVLFDDGYELQQKIEYYLHRDNENERKEMVMAAKEKVSKCTFDNRLNEIVLPAIEEVLEQYVSYIRS